MSKHTAGPLEVLAGGSRIIIAQAEKPNEDLGELFCKDTHTVATSREEALANAQLWAASPALLHAARCIYAGVPDSLREHHSKFEAGQLMQIVVTAGGLAALQAAINEAEKEVRS